MQMTSGDSVTVNIFKSSTLLTILRAFMYKNLIKVEGALSYCLYRIGGFETRPVRLSPPVVGGCWSLVPDAKLLLAASWFWSARSITGDTPAPVLRGDYMCGWPRVVNKIFVKWKLLSISTSTWTSIILNKNLRSFNIIFSWRDLSCKSPTLAIHGRYIDNKLSKSIVQEAISMVLEQQYSPKHYIA